MAERKRIHSISGAWYYAIKWIACITMAADHIAKTTGITELLPDDTQIAMGAIGRIAFPLFCWELVQHFLHCKEDKRKDTLIRLGGIAVLSQVPYGYLWPEEGLNVCFTLTLGWGVMMLIDKNYSKDTSTALKGILVIVAGCVCATGMDYGYTGIAFIVLLYVAARSGKPALWELIVFLIFTVEMGFTTAAGIGQLTARNIAACIAFNTLIVIAWAPVFLARKGTGIIQPIGNILTGNASKQAGRWFYPAHLAILAVISFILR